MVADLVGHQVREEEVSIKDQLVSYSFRDHIAINCCNTFNDVPSD